MEQIGDLSFSDIPDWPAQDHSRLLGLFAAQGIAAISDLLGKARLCEETHARDFFEMEFFPLRMGAQGQAHITGYFEPSLDARLAPEGDFQFPIFSPPADLTPLWHSRAEIEGEKRSQLRGYEIAYLQSQLDLFFLHVQGSGVLRLLDGSLRRIRFAGRNGHAYRSIGAEMIARGLIPEKRMSAQAIRDWFSQNPTRLHEILHLNPSYIFFHWHDGQAAMGAASQALTAHHSVAIDPDFIPYGLPLVVSFGKQSRFALAQDCGSAIKGPNRVDIFCGTGDAAGQIAGALRERGDVILLVPKDAGLRRRLGI